jgi:dipeptidyl aminopeptidase/acylaminoacyl peptidase
VTIRPYGTWQSPVTADLVASSGGVHIGAVKVDGERVRWSESRPEDGGRVAVVDSTGIELTPSGANARTRVHEYGGGAVWYHGDTVFYSEFTDSRVYRVDSSGTRAITPEPPKPNSLRYADGVVTNDGTTIVCVRERHEADGVINELVSFAADGSGEAKIVAGGHDFFSSPRFDPSGKKLAWLAWNHPNMPWDGTELFVDGEVVAGGRDESVIDVRWSRDGALHYASDSTGWWNLYRDGEALTSLVGAEIGFPAWVFGMSRYVLLDDGRIVCVVTRDAVDSLHLLDPAQRELIDLDLDWTAYETTIASDGSRVVFTAASPTDPTALVSYDVATGEQTVLKRTLEVALDRASISVPRAIEFPTRDGQVAHAFYYPPSGGEGPGNERPPLRVCCHGGPTAHSEPKFDIDYEYWTTRGFGVVDVNYRGSTGYGREYRRLLNGRWGEIDWQDCVSAARYLAEQGEADPERTWVEGGSAGGYVVFCALVYDPTSFAAGVSYFGVADVEALAADTHKFESRYLDSMIGPYPERADLYRERSPVHFADRLERPMLLLQGLDDKVVLPEQAEMMVGVLERKGVPYEYIPFEGEGHGFRKHENIVHALEAELAFIRRTFEF